jgi:hypothetical protein
VIGRVAQEDTSGGPRGELMGRGGGDVRITCTTVHNRRRGGARTRVRSQRERHEGRQH